MNKTLILPVLGAALVLTACQQPSAPEPEANTAVDAPLVLDSTEERLSYGIAFGLGGQLVADGVPLDVDAFTAGLRDAKAGNDPLMTQEEISAEMMTYQQERQAEMQAERDSLGSKNMAEGAAFLAENATKEGVVTTESGLQYLVVEAGDGASPTSEDTVEVHYHGTFIDGSVFDSSVDRGETVKFGVTQVISGWTEALQLMKVGAKWKVFLTSDLAYGPMGSQSIPPGATLLFDIELISIEK
jgi:FKBP-type peptidyl-prolyl cis-trans isomerase